MNTNSIQTGINYIHKEGGGVLVFNVGRYLTGSIELKSNVAIQLKEGAVLVGSLNPYDYNMEGPCYSMIRAINQKNIAIYGKGIIDAQGRQVSYNIIDQVHKGFIKDPLENDRPRRPRGIHFKQCRGITIEGITIKIPVIGHRNMKNAIRYGSGVLQSTIKHIGIMMVLISSIARMF